MSKILSSVKTIEVTWRTCDGLDEDETNERRHPFVFLFSLQDDDVAFHEDIRDRRKMQVF